MIDSKEVMERIKKEKERMNYSSSELARRVGIAKSSLSRYENGEREFPINDIGKYAMVLETSVEYLLGLEDGKSHNHSNYPYYPVSVSAGLPIEVDSINASNQIPIPDIALNNYAGDKNIYFIHANGDSMDKIFPDGALLAVRQVKSTSELCDGDIVVFSTDGDYSVKRFYKADDKLIFRPESHNPVHTDQIYSSDDEIHIHGKVVTYIVNL